MADSSDDITSGAHVDNGVEAGGTDAEVSRAIALTLPPTRGRVRNKIIKQYIHKIKQKFYKAYRGKSVQILELGISKIII